MQQLPDNFTILALETSCDETAAAVVRGGRTLLANVVASQLALHQRFGGIVPEVASRQHILALAPVVNEALRAVPEGWDGIHALAATIGPGLSGALLTGLNAAKAMAWQRGLPFVPVNHLEAHIYANWIITTSGANVVGDDALCFPLVALVVSGGHTLLALLHDHGQYELLGQTRDDAVGEAFDKVARMLGLGYPGGPAIEQIARNANSAPNALPRAWLRESFDFSFSGLKTAVLHKTQERQELAARIARPATTTAASTGERRPTRGREVPGLPSQTTVAAAPPSSAAALDPQFVAQIAHAFQESVVDVLCTKTVEAATRYGANAILLAGGVAANTRLRNELTRRAAVPVHFPPLALCTDNAAMVAAAAFYRFVPANDWASDVDPSLRLGM